MITIKRRLYSQGSNEVPADNDAFTRSGQQCKDDRRATTPGFMILREAVVRAAGARLGGDVVKCLSGRLAQLNLICLEQDHQFWHQTRSVALAYISRMILACRFRPILFQKPPSFFRFVLHHG